MDALVDGGRLAFGDFRLEPHSGRLYRCDTTGTWWPVPIGSRAAQILRVLLDGAGTIVSKNAIMDAVWPGIVVEPNNLTVQIAALRRVLDNGHSGDSCIETVPGRGYRLTLRVMPVAETASALPIAASPVVPVARSKAWSIRRWHIVTAGAVATIVLLLFVAWSGGWAKKGMDRRQSVIVLPFENSSGDPTQDDLAATLTRNLTNRVALG